VTLTQLMASLIFFATHLDTRRR